MIAALDIGNSKVVVLVGGVDSGGELRVSGAGHASLPKGVKHGVVTSIKLTTEAIQKAVDEAELMSGGTIDSCFISVGGNHIDSLSDDGLVALASNEVTQEDITRVIDAAGTSDKISSDRVILHKIPQDFKLDGQSGISDPLGMTGMRLATRVQLITCPKNVLANLEKCIEGCNIRVEAAVLGQYAESFAVLPEDQKEMGVCLVKIGAGTTDVAVFLNGSLHYAASIPVGGSLVTNDIALALRTPPKSAEEIKIRHACAMSRLVKDDEVINVPGVGDRESHKLHRKTLVEFVEPRYEEIFSMVQEKLRASGIEQFVGAGIVLTGGAVEIQGSAELAAEIFHLPVRIGYPPQAEGMGHIIDSPSYATSVGLLLYGSQQQQFIQNQETIIKSPNSLVSKLQKWTNKW